jgi:hypothetical protein
MATWQFLPQGHCMQIATTSCQIATTSMIAKNADAHPDQHDRIMLMSAENLLGQADRSFSHGLPCLL